eukprot:scaffold7221_cov61-Cylindrotheca_fusiformis.AAC.1
MQMWMPLAIVLECWVNSHPERRWLVIPEEDGMLFHNVSYPQYPEKCIDPEARAMKRRRRRLGESFITDEQAEAACAPIEDALDRKDCIYDVLVTQDLTMVGAY